MRFTPKSLALDWRLKVSYVLLMFAAGSLCEFFQLRGYGQPLMGIISEFCFAHISGFCLAFMWMFWGKEL